jgi:hypothetical protein
MAMILADTPAAPFYGRLSTSVRPEGKPSLTRVI